MLKTTGNISDEMNLKRAKVQYVVDKLKQEGKIKSAGRFGQAWVYDDESIKLIKKECKKLYK
jgi:predicted transcriptional regulator|tara:strand:- start:37 stop:222 length:186 start_codon:yes stop_codon:yes gene_type:complete